MNKKKKLMKIIFYFKKIIEKEKKMKMKKMVRIKVTILKKRKKSIKG